MDKDEKPLPGNIATYIQGSNKLTDIITSNRDRIVCNVHGHSHEGAFLQTFTKPFKSPLPIINPGSVMSGHFGELFISKPKGGKWKVSQVNKFYF